MESVLLADQWGKRTTECGLFSLCSRRSYLVAAAPQQSLTEEWVRTHLSISLFFDMNWRIVKGGKLPQVAEKNLGLQKIFAATFVVLA